MGKWGDSLDSSKKDAIIDLQKEIISEYQKTQTFLNRTFMTTIRDYRSKINRSEVEKELLMYAGYCNDCMIDNPKLDQLLKQLDKYNEK
nr:hypothetical protein [Mycobacterium sp. E3298]